MQSRYSSIEVAATHDGVKAWTEGNITQPPEIAVMDYIINNSDLITGYTSVSHVLLGTLGVAALESLVSKNYVIYK